MRVKQKRAASPAVYAVCKNILLIRINRMELFMKKYSIANLAAVYIVSFVAWVYCVAIAVLGLIYQAYPGQDKVSVLIGTLPTIVTLITALAGPFIMKALTRKWSVIISIAISIVCGLAILLIKMPLIGVIVCSAALGIPAGLIPAANSSIVTIIAPLSLKDKVIGWHNAIMMLGMSAFTLLAGIFAKTGDFRDGYKSVFVLIPVIIIAILLYPNVDKDNIAVENEAAHNAQGAALNKTKEKMPGYVLVFIVLYLVGAIFWNAWFVNYSDYIINEAAIGDASVAGLVGSLSSFAGCIAGFFVALWIKATKQWSMPLAFILTGVTMLLPSLTQSAMGCYVGGFLCQLFNLFLVSGLTTYTGLATDGKSYATTALCLITVAEGAGVFLCGYILPAMSSLFGGGAGMNLIVASVLMIIIGIATFFFIKPVHQKVYTDGNKLEE